TLPLTRSAAAAISSAIATVVACSSRPWESRVPRRSAIGWKPATPIAMSAMPRRQGRPTVSVTTTPGRTPSRAFRPRRSRRADSSGSSGSSSTVPFGTLLASMPAAASTSPWWVSTMRMTEPSGFSRRATSRTDSASIRASRSAARASRPSALATIFDATTTTSSPVMPSEPSGHTRPASSGVSTAARSVPEVIEGSRSGAWARSERAALSAGERGQHVATEDLDPLALVAPDVVQVDAVEAEVEVALDLRAVQVGVGGDHHRPREVLGPDGPGDLGEHERAADVATGEPHGAVRPLTHRVGHRLLVGLGPGQVQL